MRREMKRGQLSADELNREGLRSGFGGCLACGDRWNWTEAKFIPCSPKERIFPLCVDCFRDLPIQAIERRIWQLIENWCMFTPGKRQNYEEQGQVAIIAARKMKGA